jgi:hypothetical protein
MEKFQELKTLVESLTEDVTKFTEKGNKSAGTRLRQGMQELKKLAQDIRVEVSAAKKTA